MNLPKWNLKRTLTTGLAAAGGAMMGALAGSVTFWVLGAMIAFSNPVTAYLAIAGGISAFFAWREGREAYEESKQNAVSDQELERRAQAQTEVSAPPNVDLSPALAKNAQAEVNPATQQQNEVVQRILDNKRRAQQAILAGTQFQAKAAAR